MSEKKAEKETKKTASKTIAHAPKKAVKEEHSHKSEKKQPKEKRKKNADEKKVLALKEKIKEKKHPIFRGRFGARFKRRKSNEKWDKWRRPRGIDTIFKNEDGALPKIGHRVPKEIRFLHPSGHQEVFVSSVNDLQKLKNPHQSFVVRLSSGIGKKKRIQIAKLAKEQNIRVLNR
mgnify:CR=1 FL=1